MITRDQLAERLELFCTAALRKITDSLNSTVTIKENGELLWQVKATLNPLEVKLKTSAQKEVNQEDQPEQESSTHSNDQTLPEKEQKPKTKSPSKVQFLVSYPLGDFREEGYPIQKNSDIATDIVTNLADGEDIAIPDIFKVQFIERNDL